MNQVCVIIPMYGKAEYTTKCIEMTLANAGMTVTILVVDDGSPEPFKYEHEQVFVHRLDQNSGYTNATNQGILWCKDNYKYVHLLNNDTEPEPNFIKILYDFMEENPVVGIASSVRKHNTENKHNIELYGADILRGYQICTDGDIPHEIIFVEWAPVCSALVRVEMLRYIGILDRRMRTWSSDLDLCIRANFNGWNVAVIMKSVVFHHHQVTTGKHINEGVSHDQRVLLEKLAGVQYAELMKKLPLDCENKTYGKLEFSMYKKEA